MTAQNRQGSEGLDPFPPFRLAEPLELGRFWLWVQPVPSLELYSLGQEYRNCDLRPARPEPVLPIVLYITVALCEEMSPCTARPSCRLSWPNLINPCDLRHLAPWVLDALCLPVMFSSREPVNPWSLGFTSSYVLTLVYCTSFCSTCTHPVKQQAQYFSAWSVALVFRPLSTHPSSDCVPNNYIGGSGVVTSRDVKGLFMIPALQATSNFEHASPSDSAFWRTMVALGIGLAELLQVQANCLILHLRLILMLVLVRAVLGCVLKPSRKFRSRMSPLGAVVPTRSLLAFACFSGSGDWAHAPAFGLSKRGQSPLHRRRKRCSQCRPRIQLRRHSFWTASLACLGLHHLPCVVWASPAGMPQALQEVANLVEGLPDQLPHATGYPWQASTRDIDIAALSRVDRAPCNLSEAFLPRHCVLFRAGYPAAHFLAHLQCPYMQEALFQEALVFYPELQEDWTLHETVPQVLNGIATIVALPSWVLDSDKTVVVLDFSCWQGPVFAWLDWKYINRTTLAAIARVHAGDCWDVLSSIGIGTRPSGHRKPCSLGQAMFSGFSRPTAFAAHAPSWATCWGSLTNGPLPHTQFRVKAYRTSGMS